MGRTAWMVRAVLVATMLLPGIALARRALPNNDMAGSKMPVEQVCTGENVQFIGVVYADLKNSDAADAVSVVCWSADRGEFVLPNNDFGDRDKVYLKCDRATEFVYGIAYKDREGSDATDGVTLICRKKEGGDERLVENNDLVGGRSFVRIAEKDAIGIQYNDRKDSDEVDGVTLVVKGD